MPRPPKPGKEPPTGTPPTGTPPFGMPPYGIPPYGTPPYGTPPFGTPPFGIPPFGTGAPPFGIPPTGAPPIWMPPIGHHHHYHQWEALWPWLMSWWSWLMPFPWLMPPLQMFDVMLRFAGARAQFWHHWFDAMAHTTQEMRKAYPLGDGGKPWYGLRDPFTGLDAPVDVKKLEQALQAGAFTPLQIAHVMWALQVMRALETTRGTQSGSGSAAAGPAW